MFPQHWHWRWRQQPQLQEQLTALTRTLGQLSPVRTVGPNVSEVAGVSANDFVGKVVAWTATSSGVARILREGDVWIVIESPTWTEMVTSEVAAF